MFDSSVCRSRHPGRIYRGVRDVDSDRIRLQHPSPRPRSFEANVGRRPTLSVRSGAANGSRRGAASSDCGGSAWRGETGGSTEPARLGGSCSRGRDSTRRCALACPLQRCAGIPAPPVPAIDGRRPPQRHVVVDRDAHRTRPGPARRGVGARATQRLDQTRPCTWARCSALADRRSTQKARSRNACAQTAGVLPSTPTSSSYKRVSHPQVGVNCPQIGSRRPQRDPHPVPTAPRLRGRCC